MLLLLSSLAGAAAYVARTNAILTHRSFEMAQAEAAADAAIVSAISELSDEQTWRHPLVGGEFQSTFQGIPTTVSISNEAGRIDINAADEDLILAFLSSQGLDEQAAKGLLRELRGSRAITEERERPQLRSIDELRQRPSWQAQHVDCWMDSLTIYTGLPGVSEVDASPKVRQAVTWGREHHVGSRNWSMSNVSTASARTGGSIIGEVIRITATVSLASNVTISREWIGRLTGKKLEPTLTMRWSRATGAPLCGGEQ